MQFLNAKQEKTLFTTVGQKIIKSPSQKIHEINFSKKNFCSHYQTNRSSTLDIKKKSDTIFQNIRFGSADQNKKEFC